MEFKTPLYEEHVKAGGQDRAVCGLPASGSVPAGVIKEHNGGTDEGRTF